MGLGDEDIKALDIYDKAGAIDPNKFTDYLGRQDVNDLKDIYRTGFTPSSIEYADPLDPFNYRRK
jgi:hypothetical protein